MSPTRGSVVFVAEENVASRTEPGAAHSPALSAGGQNAVTPFNALVVCSDSSRISQDYARSSVCAVSAVFMSVLIWRGWEAGGGGGGGRLETE